MLREGKVYLAQGESPCYLLPQMANRHGLIAGASGTGKTITLKVMAESFSALGVPVFLVDVKGDLAGMCLPGDLAKIQGRVDKLGLAGFAAEAYPTRFWDVYGEDGHPVRATISDMGPILLSRLLDLSDVQEGVLNLTFRVADDNGLLLIDLKDLRAMLQYVAAHRQELSATYGAASTQSIGAIQRALLTLEDQGGGLFFGEPDLDIFDWMVQDENGRGEINVLHCAKLIQNPDLYAAFMLWMLSELYERMPEAGDLEKPKVVFFFDEAHLLFSGAPKALVEKVEQVIKLIRSKGVGIFFISQSPSDLPDSVLAQLSNRVQHALRAYTPKEQKAVRAAAQSFRQNPAFDTAAAIGELGVGEALISTLDEEGRPGVVQRAFVLPPQSKMGLIDDALRAQMIAQSPLNEKYAAAVDRESAYEVISRQAELEQQAQAQAEIAAARQKQWEAEEKERQKRQAQFERAQARRLRDLERSLAPAPRRTSVKRAPAPRRRQPQTVEQAAGQALGQIGRALGDQLMRGLFGSLTGRR